MFRPFFWNDFVWGTLKKTRKYSLGSSNSISEEVNIYYIHVYMEISGHKHLAEFNPVNFNIYYILIEDESEFMGCCWHQSYSLCNIEFLSVSCLLQGGSDISQRRKQLKAHQLLEF